MHWDEYRHEHRSISENDRLVDKIFGVGKNRNAMISITYHIPLLPENWTRLTRDELDPLWKDMEARQKELLERINEHCVRLDVGCFIEPPTYLEEGICIECATGPDEFRKLLNALDRDPKIKDLMFPPGSGRSLEG